MSDYAGGRILYTKNGSVHAHRTSGGQDTLLLDSRGGAPVVATYDTHGLGWARGRAVSFACAGCVAYGS